MTASRDLDSLKRYYQKQYIRHLKDLQALIAGELELMKTDPEPTCLSALQMASDNAIVNGQRLTALQEVTVIDPQTKSRRQTKA